MLSRRVVITGAGAISPFGAGADILVSSIRQGLSAVRAEPSLLEIAGMRTAVAARVGRLDVKAIDRKKRRYMADSAKYAALAAFEALDAAGLGRSLDGRRDCGICAGTTTPSTVEMDSYLRLLETTGGIEQIMSTSFFKTMNHSLSANLSQVLAAGGMAISQSAACATATVGIALGFELIAAGRQELMLCGGADEYHALTSATFDILETASSRYNDRPEIASRPFDAARDGVVCGEGAGLLLLESLDHVRARGAEDRILAEIAGASVLSAPDEIAAPDRAAIAATMREALAMAELPGDRIDHVNAHATATDQGDVAECQAIAEVLGPEVPVTSLKGHMGHTMAACGALESIVALDMLAEGYLPANRNLDDPDPRCGVVNLVRRERPATVETILKNNYALGGVHASIILRKYTP